MLYREVPKNGDKLSVLGFGLMRLPGHLQRINRKQAEKQIFSAIDRGVNYLDTAVPYHNGKSESFLGDILLKDGYRKKVKIATKLPHWMTPSKEKMAQMLDKQLAKLKTDYIDYYLLHNIPLDAWKKAKHRGVIEFLEEAKQKGKILNTGFSYHGAAEEFKSVVDDYDWTICQIQYNFLDTHHQAGTAGLKYAASKNIGVIIMEPLRGGNLAKNPPEPVREIWQQSDQKRTPVEWSLRFIWDHPEVITVLSGMNKQAQIEENLKIADTASPGSLTEKERILISRAADAYRKVMKVGCTGCQYCMPCPVGVNIPLCFDTYNSYHAFRDWQAKIFYAVMNCGFLTRETSFASQCVECGKCMKVCPQQIEIPKELKKVEKDMEGFFTNAATWFLTRERKKKQKGRRRNRAHPGEYGNS